MNGFGLPRARRLRRPQEFDRVFKHGVRAGDDRLLVIGCANQQEYSRSGFVVSKKNGNSVCRHHLKRLLRESFRLLQHDLPIGFDFVVIPRPLPPATIAEFQDSLRGCIRRLCKKAAGST